MNNGVSNWFDWNREVVVLPGDSNGIGRQMAHLLGDHGIKVAILDIHPPQKDPSRLPPTVRFHKCDVTSPAAIAAIAAGIRGTLGQPTVFINNAGVCTGKTILSGTEAQMRLKFEVNTREDYWLAREFLPHMVTRDHGIVVTVASLAGYTTNPNIVNYSVTKGRGDFVP